MRRTPFGILVIALALGVAACGGGGGGGDEDRQADPEAGIQKAVSAFVGSDDPADCRRYSTPRALEQMAKVSYDVALAICEALTDNPRVEDAEKVIVSAIEIDERAATGVAFVMGSVIDGQTLKFALVERDGRWQVDEVLGFFDLDEKKLAMEWGRLQLLLATSPEEAESATCLMNRLLELSEENLEAMYLGRDPDPVRELSQSCASRSDVL